MRVVAGSARGITLETIEGLATRPTTDRVKEALFSMLHNDLYNSEVLDLFSGSGALGIEAASRGARKVVLVENSKKCIEVIKKNVQKTKLNDKIEMVERDVDTFMKNIDTEQAFDFILMDPPYLKGFIEPILEQIETKALIKESGKIIIEHDMKDVLQENYGTLYLDKKEEIRKNSRIGL